MTIKHIISKRETRIYLIKTAKYLNISGRTFLKISKPISRCRGYLNSCMSLLVQHERTMLNQHNTFYWIHSDASAMRMHQYVFNKNWEKSPGRNSFLLCNESNREHSNVLIENATYMYGKLNVPFESTRRGRWGWSRVLCAGQKQEGAAERREMGNNETGVSGMMGVK